MSRFTTRVELHKPEPGDYTLLHEAMKEEGFSRFIISSEGAKKRLPTAEYNREGDLTIEQVFDSAERAATSTNKKFAILVTQSYRRRFTGLQSV